MSSHFWRCETTPEQVVETVHVEAVVAGTHLKVPLGEPDLALELGHIDIGTLDAAAPQHGEQR